MPYTDGHFNAVLDKGTLDALLVSEEADVVDNVTKMFVEVRPDFLAPTLIVFFWLNFWTFFLMRFLLFRLFEICFYLFILNWFGGS